MTDDLHQPGRRHVVSLTPGGPLVGDGSFLLVAGPCAVEHHEQLLDAARAVAAAGAGALRGGAWKPRTSPRSFQGIGREGLELLARAREATGLPIITEALDIRDVEEAAAVADVLQVGARNMANTALLREVGAAGRPVLLKRGFGATISELLNAAEYVLEAGNPDVILCERGIRTFETSTRFTLDVAAVPVLRSRTHLPVIVDPSHAAGDRRLVPALARAAVAAGADGVMVEVHSDPGSALSDGAQSMEPVAFAALAGELRAIADVVRRAAIGVDELAGSALRD